MNPLIAATGLRAGYATGDVLQEVSIEVGTGEIVGVLGRNGVGKTTLMRALIGLYPRSGSILYRGGDITRQPANRRAALGIGDVPQGRESSRTCRSWIICAWGNSSIARASSTDEVYGYFPFLRDRSRQRAGTFSGGQQEMLAIARALVAGPDLLLLDEPSDVSSQASCTTSVISSSAWSKSDRSAFSSLSRISSS